MKKHLGLAPAPRSLLSHFPQPQPCPFYLSGLSEPPRDPLKSSRQSRGHDLHLEESALSYRTLPGGMWAEREVGCVLRLPCTVSHVPAYKTRTSQRLLSVPAPPTTRLHRGESRLSSGWKAHLQSLWFISLQIWELRPSKSPKHGSKPLLSGGCPWVLEAKS